MKLLLLGLLTTLFIGSCSLKDRERRPKAVKAPITGAIKGTSGKGTLYAVLYRLTPSRPEPLSHQVITHGHRYQFAAPLGQDLGVAAFEDLNRNRRQDVGEPAGFTRLPRLTPSALKHSPNKSIALSRRTKRIRYPITVPFYQTALARQTVPAQTISSKNPPARKPLAKRLVPHAPQPREARPALASPKPTLKPTKAPRAKRVAPKHPIPGSVVNLSDRRFSNQSAAFGFDDPDRFVAQYGFGLYFVDNYRSNRIPVICIHSSGGSAQDWRSFFPRLDLSRYQPMIYQYPTGMPFDRAAESLHRIVVDLGRQYRFKTVHVVGHGTGGLIGYRLAQWSARSQVGPRVTNLVTLAAPWDGMPGSARNVRRGHSSWDLRTGSPFLQRINREPLPRGVRHHVVFANKNAANLRSQLARGKRAPSYGFATDERGLMRSAGAGRQVNRCLGARR